MAADLKYLDYQGVSTFWAHIKKYVDGKVGGTDVVKGLTGCTLAKETNSNWYKGNVTVTKGDGTTSNCEIKFDGTDFLKDSVLDSVSYVATKPSGYSGNVTFPALKFVWNTGSGKSDLYVSMSSLVDTYTADGTTITKSGNQFSVNSTKAGNWDAAYTHSQAAHAPSNAQANVIETVKVNGTALTVSSKAVNVTVPTKVSDLTNDSGFTTNTGTVTQVKVGDAAYNPSSGVVSLPAYPTTLPASDVSAWAKAATKPTYTAAEVGAATSDHTHDISIAASSGTNQLSLSANTKYSLTAGGKSYIFTTPKDTTYNAATTSAAGLMSSADKTKLNGIATGAEVNQNAFSKIAVGSTTVEADSKTDTLTLVAGTNITLTPDATNDKITIAATDTTYSAATTSAAGLMSAADKTKLDGIETGANNYSHPTGDGNLHVPATGTSNDGKFLTAGSTAGSLSWTSLPTASTTKAGIIQIGTGSSNAAAGNHNHGKSYVSTTSNQGLSTDQQSAARANIGAGTSNLTIGTTSTTAAAGNHNHDSVYHPLMTAITISDIDDICGFTVTTA